MSLSLSKAGANSSDICIGCAVGTYSPVAGILHGDDFLAICNLSSFDAFLQNALDRCYQCRGMRSLLGRIIFELHWSNKLNKPLSEAAANSQMFYCTTKLRTFPQQAVTSVSDEKIRIYPGESSTAACVPCPRGDFSSIIGKIMPLFLLCSCFYQRRLLLWSIENFNLIFIFYARRLCMCFLFRRVIRVSWRWMELLSRGVKVSNGYLDVADTSLKIDDTKSFQHHMKLVMTLNTSNTIWSWSCTCVLIKFNSFYWA